MAYRLLGPLGAPLGTTLALVAGAAYFARAFHPLLGISTLALLREAAVVPVLGSLAGVLAGELAAAGFSFADRASALLRLTVEGVVFLGVFLLVCVLTRQLGMVELRELRGALGRGGVARSRGTEREAT